MVHKASETDCKRKHDKALLKEEKKRLKYAKKRLKREKEDKTLLKREKEDKTLLKREKEEKTLLKREKEDKKRLKREKEDKKRLKREKEDKKNLKREKEEKTLLRREKEDKKRLRKEKEDKKRLKREKEDKKRLKRENEDKTHKENIPHEGEAKKAEHNHTHETEKKHDKVLVESPNSASNADSAIVSIIESGGSTTIPASATSNQMEEHRNHTNHARQEATDSTDGCDEFYDTMDLLQEEIPEDAELVIAGRVYRRVHLPPGEKPSSELLLRTFCDRWYAQKFLKKISLATGLRVPTGHYTKAEHKLAKEIMEKYCCENNMTIEEFRDLFMRHDSGARPASDHRKVLQKGFLMQAAVHFGGRPLASLNRFYRRLLHPEHKLGAWSKEESALLLQLYAIHGPKWNVIGSQVGRSNSSCHDQFRSLTFGYLGADWTALEVNKLVQVVAAYRLEHAYVFTNSSGQSVTKYPREVNWRWVAARMDNRNSRNCFVKWSMLKTLFERKGHIRETLQVQSKSWSLQDEAVLLRHIYNLGYTAVSEINWAEVSESISNATDPAMRFSNATLQKSFTENDLSLRVQLLNKRYKCRRLDMTFRHMISDPLLRKPNRQVPLTPDCISSDDENFE